MNTFKFSSGLVTRYDNITLGKADDIASPQDPSDLTFNVHTMNYYLDISSQASADFTAFIRIAGSKIMNDYGADDFNRQRFHNESASRYNQDNTARFERLFFNYQITDSLIFSAGRLPTVDGPPLHLTVNEVPMGTYPRMLYGATLDGYALTYKMGDVTFRGIYHPLNLGTEVGGSWSIPKYKPVKSYTHKQVGSMRWENTNADMNALMIDYESSFSFVRNLNVILQSLIFENAKVGDNRSLTNIGTSPDGVTLGSSLRGDYRQYTAYLGLEGIANSGFSLALSHTITENESRGNAVNDLTPALIVGFMTDKLEDKNTGAGTLLSLAYKIRSQALKNPLISLEYLNSDKYYNFWDFSGDDPLLFYANRGSGMKLSYNQPISSNLSARIGYLSVDQKYSSGFAGAPKELDGVTNKNMFLEFRAKF